MAERSSRERPESTARSRSSERAARRTVEPVSDFDEVRGTVSHLDSAGGSLPRLKSNRVGASLSRDIHVGQYLQVPSSHHSIFTVSEQQRRVRTAIAAVIAIAVVAAAAYLAWRFILNPGA